MFNDNSNTTTNYCTSLACNNNDSQLAVNANNDISNEKEEIIIEDKNELTKPIKNEYTPVGFKYWSFIQPRK